MKKYILWIIIIIVIDTLALFIDLFSTHYTANWDFISSLILGVTLVFIAKYAIDTKELVNIQKRINDQQDIAIKAQQKTIEIQNLRELTPVITHECKLIKTSEGYDFGFYLSNHTMQYVKNKVWISFVFNSIIEFLDYPQYNGSKEWVLPPMTQLYGHFLLNDKSLSCIKMTYNDFEKYLIDKKEIRLVVMFESYNDELNLIKVKSPKICYLFKYVDGEISIIIDI